MFYGQISVFHVLPVTACIVLRANPWFRHFARNRLSCFTGKSLFSAFCP
nr:vitamin B12-binding protein [Ligilactobacillus ruminis]